MKKKIDSCYFFVKTVFFNIDMIKHNQCILFTNKYYIILLDEIIIETEDQFFEKPDWILKEVTGIEKYYNAYLTKHTVK
ncbi:MAG: hypothetical protein ACK4K1_03760 [Flavobacterium sp.]